MFHKKIPSFRLHRGSGQAVVTLDGKDHYLGRHDSPESRIRYDRLIAEWLAAGRVAIPAPGSIMTVQEAIGVYWRVARQDHTRDGKVQGSGLRIRRSLDFVLELYGSERAVDFGPRKLKAVRERMVAKGWKRSMVNSCTQCVKRAWRWLASEELVPSTVADALRTVEGLHKGRTTAPESEDVRPAPETSIAAAKALVNTQVSAMIDLQLLTGMRPGEVTALRPCELDRTGRVVLKGGSALELPGVWVYVPQLHKTANWGHARIILIGPAAQSVLAPFLDRDPLAYCFSPAEAALAAHKKPRRSQAADPRNPQRRPGRKYDTFSYGKAVRSACERAAVPSFSPNQLRHNAATALVDQFGWEVARIVLGHRSVSVTRRYVEDALTKAAAAIRQAG